MRMSDWISDVCSSDLGDAATQIADRELQLAEPAQQVEFIRTAAPGEAQLVELLDRLVVVDQLARQQQTGLGEFGQRPGAAVTAAGCLRPQADRALRLEGGFRHPPAVVLDLRRLPPGDR